MSTRETPKIYKSLIKQISESPIISLRMSRSKAAVAFLALKRISVAELAKAAGVSRNTVYLDISGEKQSPTLRAYVERMWGHCPW